MTSIAERIREELVADISKITATEAVVKASDFRDRLLRRDYRSEAERQAMVDALPLLDGVVDPRPEVTEDAAREAYRRKLGDDLKAARDAGDEYEAQRVRELIAAETRFDIGMHEALQKTKALQASIDSDRAKSKERADAEFQKFRDDRISALTIASRDIPREQVEAQFDRSHDAKNARDMINRRYGVS